MTQGDEVPIKENAGSPVSGQGIRQDTPASPKRRKFWLIAGALILIVIIGIVITRSSKDSKSSAPTGAPPVATIKAATAHLGDINYYVEALGTVTPVATVNLYSQVNGVVTAVHYSEGQMVHRGDPLIDIDPRPYEAQLQQVEGTLEHDRGVLAQAEMDLTRYDKAATQHAIAQQTYDDQKLAVEQYRGTVKNDVGQVQYAQVQLSYCHLTSPINGRIGLRLIDRGNTVFSGSSNPLVVITQLQPITVVFDVAEDNLGQVRDQILHRTALRVDALDRAQEKKLASGTLLTLDNQVDTSTGTVRFRAQFDNAGLTLFPNQFVNTRLLIKTLKSAVLVPSAAVQRNGTQAFVYVVTGNKVKTQAVTELTTEGDISAVTGIDAGTVVPITGFDKLQNGSAVKIQSMTAFGSDSQQERAPAKSGSTL